jgi:hypothetical protein
MTDAPIAARRVRAGMPPPGLAVLVVVFAIAMAYLESAVVVYLRAALGAATGEVFPIDLSVDSELLGWIEIGREAATIVMIGAVGWIVGRSPLERLAWSAVVFGAWDIGYYAWLWVFSGWPSGLDTWDLLFLIPLPWAGPVWAPVVVSLLLVGFGLALAGLTHERGESHASVGQLGVLIGGGLVVIASFLTNAGVILDGGTPVDFAWPIYWAGIGIGVVAATWILRSNAEPQPVSRSG